jgi:glycosyltransferase involved in cell wall biosynthesis
MGGNNMSEAKIAVVLCNFNDSRFLIDVIEKIARQDPDEFIIVDDRSDDRSLELLKCLAPHYNFKIVQNTGVHSPFGSFVAGCAATDADFVACFSADDYPNENYMQLMRAAVNTFPMVSVFTCNTDVIREGEMYKRTLLPFTAYISPDYAVKIFQAGFAKNINQCGIVIRREWVLACWAAGGKDTEASFDCLYSFSTIFSGGFVNRGEYLTTYRSYPNSFGAAGSNRKIKQAIAVHKKLYLDIQSPADKEVGKRAYERAMASGIWSRKARWKALVALWGIMKLPKWARKKFYKWFYSYSQAVEKL